MWGYRSFPAGFETAAGVRGLTGHAAVIVAYINITGPFSVEATK